MEEIVFDGSIPAKTTPELMDSETKILRDQAIKHIEKTQILEQEKIKAGIKEPIKEVESIPKELPNLFFKFGSKVLKCEKFRTDEEENKIIAKHLSNLIGAQNSKIYSLIVILIIISSKVSDCWEAVTKLIHRKKKDDEKKKEDTMSVYEESKKAEVSG